MVCGVCFVIDWLIQGWCYIVGVVFIKFDVLSMGYGYSEYYGYYYCYEMEFKG